jgi:chromosome condensin MukBEF ATPase and DNA-binding subunit MukB
VEGPTAREKAEQWLATYTADLNAATDAEQLAAIHAKADKAVAKLEREFPDLHEQALALRPTVQDTDEHPARTVADRIITAAATATTIVDLNSLRADSAEHIEAMPEDLAAEVRRALGEAEKRLGRK